MINNQKCVNCAIFDICKAAGKLKAFTDEARTDLGVTLDFVGCDNYRDMDEEGTEKDSEYSSEEEL